MPTPREWASSSWEKASYVCDVRSPYSCSHQVMPSTILSQNTLIQKLHGVGYVIMVSELSQTVSKNKPLYFIVISPQVFCHRIRQQTKMGLERWVSS